MRIYLNNLTLLNSFIDCVLRSCLLCLITVFIIGCSSPQKMITQRLKMTDDPDLIIQQLYLQLEQWQGVPYQFGGNTKSGIDCSGFVHVTFLDKFDSLVPRTTQLLASYGSLVSKQALSPGDLVFFKTEKKNRHVGIYVEKGKFIHASTSRGVMMSSLNNQYWQQAFWQVRRVSQ